MKDAVINDPLLQINVMFKEILDAFALIPEAISGLNEPELKKAHIRYYDEIIQTLYTSDKLFKQAVDNIKKGD